MNNIIIEKSDKLKVDTNTIFSQIQGSVEKIAAEKAEESIEVELDAKADALKVENCSKFEIHEEPFGIVQTSVNQLENVVRQIQNHLTGTQTVGKSKAQELVSSPSVSRESDDGPVSHSHLDKCKDSSYEEDWEELCPMWKT